MTEPARRDCDVLIVGGGAVGSALACALAELPLDTVLVEAQEVRQLSQPGFDTRVTALANGSQQILAALSLWTELKGYTEAIRTIHISERGRFGAARQLQGFQARGYALHLVALGFQVVTHEEQRGLVIVHDKQAISGTRRVFCNSREVLASQIG